MYIRHKLSESPMFVKQKKLHKLSNNPLKDAFTHKDNLKIVLMCLFGAALGQGVIWYTGQFYALLFIQTVLKVDNRASYLIVAGALACAVPFFILFGWLSDTYGRKPFMFAGFLLAIVTFYPIFNLMHYLGPYVDAKAAVLVPSDNYSPVGIAACVWVMVIYAALSYAPIAAFLVELFPTSIRYTAMSLPYHIGSGVGGGLVPLISSGVVWATGNIYSGLWYPMAAAALSLIVLILFVPETYKVNIETIGDDIELPK
jgi:MFS family permease